MPFKYLTSVILSSFIICCTESVVTDHRDERLFNFITIFTFGNDICTGNNGLQGTCLTVKECLVGLPHTDMSGTCANGFGVCCIVTPSCDSTTNYNNTLLRSPEYIKSFNYGFDCEYRIRVSPQICQLRLDITDISLSPPDKYGVCQNDFFEVSHDNKFGKICGTTKDNHFYLDVQTSSFFDAVSFKFHTTSSVSYERKWMIKVARIRCGAYWEVPNGCGQYFTGTSGTIKGFNYDSTINEKYYLHDQNYGICVRLEQGYCSVTYNDPVKYFTRPKDFFERMDHQSSGQDFKYVTYNNFPGETRTVTLKTDYIIYYKSDSSVADHLLGPVTGNNAWPPYYFTYTQNKCN